MVMLVVSIYLQVLICSVIGEVICVSTGCMYFNCWISIWEPGPTLYQHYDFLVVLIKPCIILPSFLQDLARSCKVVMARIDKICSI